MPKDLINLIGLNLIRLFEKFELVRHKKSDSTNLIQQKTPALPLPLTLPDLSILMNRIRLVC